MRRGCVWYNTQSMSIWHIVSYYIPFLLKYKKTVFLTFASYGIANVLAHFVYPVLYKEIIDVASSGVEPAAVAPHLFQLILLLALAILAYNILFRIGDWAIVYSESAGVRDVANDAYKRLHAHSYEFFTNRFAGALVTKLKRYVSSFETLYDNLVYSLWFDGLKLASAIVALWIFAPQLLGIFLVWFFGFLFFSYFLIKVQYARDAKKAEAESNTTGVLADTITNVLNIKMFAALPYEKRKFRAMTTKKRKHETSRGIWEICKMYFVVHMLVCLR